MKYSQIQVKAENKWFYTGQNENESSEKCRKVEDTKLYKKNMLCMRWKEIINVEKTLGKCLNNFALNIFWISILMI